MTVTVRLLGLHRALLPPQQRQQGSVQLRFGADKVTVAAIVAKLGMAPETGRMVLIDGEVVGDEHVVHDGQTVVFVSPLGGG